MDSGEWLSQERKRMECNRDGCVLMISVISYLTISKVDMV